MDATTNNIDGAALPVELNAAAKPNQRDKNVTKTAAKLFKNYPPQR
jgi:hypothetical protein